jgi:hypothetical protein
MNVLRYGMLGRILDCSLGSSSEVIKVLAALPIGTPDPHTFWLQ